eukprot:358495-Chlamydomonas_euryale.AAC.9
MSWLQSGRVVMRGRGAWRRYCGRGVTRCGRCGVDRLRGHVWTRGMQEVVWTRCDDAVWTGRGVMWGRAAWRR